MTPIEDLGCLAVALGWEADGTPHLPELPNHLHRCASTRHGHDGRHWCGCGRMFDVNLFAVAVEWEPDDQIIEKMELEIVRELERSWPEPLGDGAHMTSPLDSLVTITMVADENTPAEFLSSAGRIIALTTPVQVGSGGHLQGIPGLVRQGIPGLEFLMMAAVPLPADTAPPWAQQLAATLDEINGKLDQILGGGARNTDMQTAIGKLDTIIGGAARQNTLNQVGAEVTAIKNKVGA